MAAPGYPEPSRPMATRDRVAGMHIDRRIAILGLLGTAALAVAMMAAPLLFADLPRWLLGLLFWGGLLLAAVLIGASIIIAFRGEASEPRIGHRRRMIALFGMIIFGVGFVGSAALYFWPMRPTPISEASSLAQLAELGWSLQHQPNGIQFVVSGSGPPPSMQRSAIYFAKLHNPFSLVFSGTNGIDGLHYLSDLSNREEISVSAGIFTDMSELRGFTHLRSLNISQTPVNGLATVDLSPLSTLTNLKKLNLFGTKATTIQPLANLQNLNFLSLKDTLVSDLSPAVGFKYLETLDITGTRISDLSPLEASEKLAELNVGGTQIPSLRHLRNLKSLKKLMIVEQGNLDITPVGELHSLETLWILAQSHLDASPIHNLIHLRNLSIMGLGIFGPATVVANIESIGDLNELRTLTIAYLMVTDLGFANRLLKLEELNLNNIPIQSVEQLRNLKSLKRISLSATQVVDISPLLELPELTELRIMQTPARADVLTELQRRGVTIK